jgi:hypothetical protein
MTPHSSLTVIYLLGQFFEHCASPSALLNTDQCYLLTNTFESPVACSTDHVIFKAILVPKSHKLITYAKVYPMVCNATAVLYTSSFNFYKFEDAQSKVNMSTN